tara:strand:+ start:397 stop:771 length:375 start_codon:yes stop_codon:yes gene_type:complete
MMRVSHGGVRLLKIDVEGMELDVLEGASALVAEQQPLIYLENDRQDNLEAKLSWLLERNYACHWHLPAYFRDDNFYGCKNDPFVQPDGKSILSANVFAAPESITVHVLERTRITSPTSWWTDLR